MPVSTGADSPPASEPDTVRRPLNVVQIARQWRDDVLQVSFALLLDAESPEPRPNGVIISQEIPDGWEVVEAKPAVQSVDERNRIVKWLFVDQAVTNNSVYTLSMRVPGRDEGDWNVAQAWYSYRRPDGRFMEAAAIPYRDNDAQP